MSTSVSDKFKPNLPRLINIEIWKEVWPFLSNTKIGHSISISLLRGFKNINFSSRDKTVHSLMFFDKTVSE